MPQKEPLTREKTVRGWRPTGDIELTDRAKDKLRGQISRAERIMRTEEPQSKGWHKGLDLRNRAQKLLGKKKPSPSKKSRSTEKSIVTHLTRKALEAVGKIGRKRDEG